jgi:hypothetical protein
MREFKLTSIIESFHIYDKYDLGSCKVKTYDELWNIIKDKMEETADEYSTWMEYMKEFTGEEDEKEIRDQMLEGSFDDQGFIVGVGEEGSVLCLDVNSDLINEDPVDVFEKIMNKVYNLN